MKSITNTFIYFAELVENYYAVMDYETLSVFTNKLTKPRYQAKIVQYLKTIVFPEDLKEKLEAVLLVNKLIIKG